MSRLLHVSSEELEPGVVLELPPQTRHAKFYKRGLVCSTGLSQDARKQLTSLRTALCGQCRDQTACRFPGNCMLVADLLSFSEELQHRAHQFVEHIFEWVRREESSHRPSRFRSLFCWESLEDARWFRETRRPGGHIYEVAPVPQTPLMHRGNMTWLDCLTDDVPTVLERARAYWKGDKCLDKEGGRWEMLVACDLKVVREVGLGNLGSAEPADKP